MTTTDVSIGGVAGVGDVTGVLLASVPLNTWTLTTFMMNASYMTSPEYTIQYGAPGSSRCHECNAGPVFNKGLRGPEGDEFATVWL